jgi:hypothetical protein
MFEIQRAAYLMIGRAIHALEEQERFLGAAFYLLLTGSLNRRMRIYCHSEAEFYKEQLEEWQADDDPENRDTYEIPAVEEAIPEPVQTLEKVEGWGHPAMRRLLRRHLHGPHGVWIEKLLTIHRLSEMKGSFVWLDDAFDSPPMPSVLIVFRMHDAIEACYDHEEDRYNEVECEPTCTVTFRPDDKEEFDQALRAMTIFLKMTQEVAELIGLLNKWEEEHAGKHPHRTELPLPAQ